MKVSVVGGGAWGTAVANLVADNVGGVRLWARDEDVVESINDRRTNPKFLAGVRLSRNLVATTSYEEALVDVELLIWAIPVQYSRERLSEITPMLGRKVVVVNLSKGFEDRTLCRPSEIIRQECPNIANVGSLGGPNIAAEVVRGDLAVATLAMERHWEFRHILTALSSNSFRVELGPDLISLETAGAIKNIVAIGAGICDGMGLGINLKSLAVSVGFEEMKKAVGLFGGNPVALGNAFGLADLLTTCFSSGSRNRTLGEGLGSRADIEDVVASLGGRVAEGLTTCGAWRQLAENAGLDCGFLHLVASIVCGDESVEKLPELLLRG